MSYALTQEVVAYWPQPEEVCDTSVTVGITLLLTFVLPSCSIGTSVLWRRVYRWTVLLITIL